MSENTEHPSQATMRRAPKLSVFLVLGGGVGAVVTFILTALFPVDEAVGFGPLLGYFLLYGIPAGIVLGAVVALILDRYSRRHTTSVLVQHETVVEADPLEADLLESDLLEAETVEAAPVEVEPLTEGPVVEAELATEAELSVDAEPDEGAR